MAQAPAGPRGPTPAPKPKPRKPKGPKIAHGFERQANVQIHQAQAPVLQELARERAANLARARAQMGFAKAAAAIMQQAAPGVQQGYTNAANATAGYARGLGDAVQAPLNANAQASNAFLRSMGTPEGALQAAPPVGGLAYGTQGYIPATSLQREGAAFGAAAQLAPGHLLAQGQQISAATLANNPNIEALQRELARIAAQRPEVYRQLVAAAQEQRMRQIAASQAQQRIQISQQNADESRRYHNLSIQMRQEEIGLKYAKDARAVADAIREGNRVDVGVSKIVGYLVDRNGDPILNKRGKRIPVTSDTDTGTGKNKRKMGLPDPKVNPNGAGAASLPIPANFVSDHDTDGLPGYPAKDMFGKPGARVTAPAAGYIKNVHMIGWDGNKRVGGWTMYLVTAQGTYFLTHMGRSFVKDGTRVKAGQPIGTLAAVPHGWWKPHVHVGFHANNAV